MKKRVGRKKVRKKPIDKLKVVGRVAPRRKAKQPLGGKAKALFELKERKEEAKKKGRINNASLHAGSLMYFYCRHCGLVSEVCPESYNWEPKKICGPCKTMEKEGWLD